MTQFLKSGMILILASGYIDALYKMLNFMGPEVPNNSFIYFFIYLICHLINNYIFKYNYCESGKIDIN